MRPKVIQALIEILLVLAILLCFLLFGGNLLLFALPRNNVSCIAKNYPSMVASKNDDGTAHEEEVEDWRVICSITVEEKKIFEEALVLGHPTRFREAMDAIDEFRRKKAAKIIKENTK